MSLVTFFSAASEQPDDVGMRLEHLHDGQLLQQVLLLGRALLLHRLHRHDRRACDEIRFGHKLLGASLPMLETGKDNGSYLVRRLVTTLLDSWSMIS